MSTGSFCLSLEVNHREGNNKKKRKKQDRKHREYLLMGQDHGCIRKVNLVVLDKQPEGKFTIAVQIGG